MSSLFKYTESNRKPHLANKADSDRPKASVIKHFADWNHFAYFRDP